ncbi:adenosylmethionine decarboxylase [Nonomuraea sp. NPDC049695]|uniref:adenosylmethionine decarboxylase n=1 Tax=Nonomuraea sp. NPDC049695 TaxID=3154734 RepID=UPI0034333350
MNGPSVVGAFQGRHVHADLYGIDPQLLDDADRLKSLLENALVEANATVLQTMTHRFTPQGVTVLALLAESHASLHTYPEHDPLEGGACFADFFTCGPSADPEQVLRLLSRGLQPRRQHISIVDRGLPVPLARPWHAQFSPLGKASA